MMTKNKARILFVILLLMIDVVYLKAEVYPSDTISIGLKRTLSFNQFLSNTEKNNLQYLAELFNIKIADAEVIASKIMPDPELNFEAADENFTVELSYDLEIGNKRGARVRLARSEAEVAKLAVGQFFQDLRAEASDAFVDAIMQRELLNLMKRSYDYVLQLSQSDSIRHRLGEISENDARQSKLEAATILNEVFQQEAEYKSALTVLNRYMGQAIDTLNVPVGEWDGLDREYILGELIPLAMANRVDLVVALKESEVAMRQLKLAQKERVMDISLMVGYERDWHGVFPKGNMIKGGITVPLQFSNFNKGSVKAAKYAQQQKELEFKNTQLEIETEVTQAFFYFEAAKRQVEQYKKGLLEESQKVLDGMVYTYKRGETSILDVLIAQRSYIEVQSQYIETMKNYTSTLINLEKSCGVWDINF